MKALALATYALLFAGSLRPVVVLIRAFSGVDSVSSFVLSLCFVAWVVSPYVVLAAAMARLSRAKNLRSAATVAAFLVSLPLAVGSWWIYGALDLTESSTSPIALVFLPLYLLVGGVLLFSIILLIAYPIARWGR